MSITEFNNNEFGQTWTWLQERSKANRHRREEQEELYYMHRLNTWIMARVQGLKQDKPQDLYSLPGEVVKPKADPFSAEANSIFDKWDKAKPVEKITINDLKKKISNGSGNR
ncbi:MAG: hypothetical protein IPN29_02015 [Saprospiraceae bacterium]|nr:hypothetical protein [Saprospiraceae bacterium]